MQPEPCLERLFQRSATSRQLKVGTFDLHRHGPAMGVRFLTPGPDIVGHRNHSRLDLNGISQVFRESRLRSRRFAFSVRLNKPVVLTSRDGVVTLTGQGIGRAFWSADSGGKAGGEPPLRHSAQPMQVDGQSGAAGARRNKVVTDGGEYVDEPLQSSRRSEALHRSLSSSKGQMRIFRPVVEALMRAMLDRGHGLTRCCSVRAELVGDDALGRNALLSQQAPQQTSRGLAVALGLQNLVENIALLIDRAPEPMFLSGDADDDLIEMPDVAAAGPLALEPANEILAEFETPTTHGLVGN